MTAVTIPNRPFSTHPATGLMMPDGIFEASVGLQEINAQFRNDSGATLAPGTVIYLESVSHPSIVVVPQTMPAAGLPAGATRIFAWNADFTTTPAGTYLISFVVHDPGGAITRQIKKIFVTRTTFDPATTTFIADTPEGRLRVALDDLIGPADACCGRDGKTPGPADYVDARGTFLDLARRFYLQRDPTFDFCLPGYLPHRVRLAMTPNPPYPGQFGDLPFQDPFWKIILCIVVVLLLIAAAIAEASGEPGGNGVTVGQPDPDGGSTPDCCGVRASGGGSSYVAAGLVAAAAAVATIAAYFDIRDPFRRGQDNTSAADGELTVLEEVSMRMTPTGPLTLGTPCSVAAKWDYTRTLSGGGTQTFHVEEVNTNVHVLSRYDINAPDVVRSYQGEPFIVRGQFFDADGKQLIGEQLYVQCFLIGPAGQWRRLPMLDDGVPPDDKPNDGVYTGRYDFARHEKKGTFEGIWTFFVIAQDLNTAQPNMDPDEAAQNIGGMVVTHQLTINLGGGTCPLVPDGHVNVI